MLEMHKEKCLFLQTGTFAYHVRYGYRRVHVFQQNKTVLKRHKGDMLAHCYTYTLVFLT